MQFSILRHDTEWMRQLVHNAAKNQAEDKAFFESEIQAWKTSEKRKAMITGAEYYRGIQDISRRKRKAIGENGKLVEVGNLPNNRIIDNQYAKMVDQKAHYLLGQPLTFDTKDKQYAAAIKPIFGKRFQRTLRNLGQDSLNGGIGWLHPYYNAENQLVFQRFEPYEILPFWADADHSILDCAVRLYEVEVYTGSTKEIVEKAEIYTREGVYKYFLRGGALEKDPEDAHHPYFTVTSRSGQPKGFNWARIPLIPFKYNGIEQPLIQRVKSLQDSINEMISDFSNNLQEDARSTILVIKNYGGENLGEFRQNLSTYGAIKVDSSPDAPGGVDTLHIEVNSENYESILKILKKALIENARGYDAKDDRMSAGTANQMNIQSMFSDIDLDANGMETEYQASFQDLLWFVNAHLQNTGQGDFSNSEIDVIFDRDMLVNESEIIEDCKNSMGMLSRETIVAQHPWVTDPEEELARLKAEEDAQMENGDYQDAFHPSNEPDLGGDPAEK